MASNKIPIYLMLKKPMKTVQINSVEPSKIAGHGVFIQIHFQSRKVEDEIRLLAALDGPDGARK
jgi:hypothetical protein